MRLSLKMATALASLLACGHAFASGPHAATDARDIDRIIETRMHESGLVGVGAAILIDGKPVWSRGYGFADKQDGRPFTTGTVMNIGSISKTFTGAALMQAVQDGKLSLDENINRYLPFKVVNPHVPDARITLRHLATHTSGITDRWEVYQHAYH